MRLPEGAFQNCENRGHLIEESTKSEKSREEATAADSPFFKKIEALRRRAAQVENRRDGDDEANLGFLIEAARLLGEEAVLTEIEGECYPTGAARAVKARFGRQIDETRREAARIKSQQAQQSRVEASAAKVSQNLDMKFVEIGERYFERARRKRAAKQD